MEKQTNQIIFIIVASVCMIAMMIFALVNLFLRYKNRQLKYQNEMLELNQVFSSELLLVRHEVTEQVLKSISVELHDNICQTLTLAVVTLNRIGLKGNTDSEDSFRSSRDTVRKALADLRNISHNLNGDYLKNFNIHEALQSLSRQLITGTDLNIKFNIKSDINFTSKDQEIIVIRILQELINNSIKHSNATTIQLMIDDAVGGVGIHYSDNGIGFQPEKIINGMGLASVKQRLDLLKAKWEFNSSPGNGFSLIAVIPVV